MRIAFVSEHASPLATLGGVDAGGQNVHVAELAAGLVRLGHQVTVYTRRDDPALPASVRTAAGYTVVHLDAGPARQVAKDDLWPLMAHFADSLGEALDEDRPDLAHAHFWMSGWALQRAARPRDVPTALTFHALGTVKRRHLGPEDPSPRARIGVERALAQEVDRVIATCTDEVAELRSAGAHPRRVSVVPCGVDVNLFTPDGPRCDDRRLPHRILAFGRMVHRKGYPTAVEALRQLPDTELVVVGGDPGPDPVRDELRALAAELDVGDRVRIGPALPHTDVPALIRSSDVVVVTPWYEPFGIVALEAMACGVPVVASAVGGMLDTVRPGETGMLVPPRSAQAVSRAVRRLLDRPDLRAAYGRAAVSRIRAEYSWDRVAAATATAYRLTVEDAPRRRTGGLATATPR